jgi:hypothetical protein
MKLVYVLCPNNTHTKKSSGCVQGREIFQVTPSPTELLPNFTSDVGSNVYYWAVCTVSTTDIIQQEMTWEPDRERRLATNLEQGGNRARTTYEEINVI